MKQGTKNKILVAGFIVSLIVAYQFAFSKTIEAKQNLNRLKRETVGLENVASMNMNLKLREVRVDSVLRKNNLNNTSIQNNLLAVLNEEAESDNILINQFNRPHSITENNVTTTSYSFILKGDYTDIEALIYSLEQEYTFGHITHVNFEKKRDYRKKKDYLICTIIIENFVSE